MAELLKGSPAAAALNERLKKRSAALRERGIVPRLVLLRIGAQEDDLFYERNAVRCCGKVGVEAESCCLPGDVPQAAVEAELRRLNEDASVHGVILLCSGARHLDLEALHAVLAPAKDVDGVTAGSLAGVFTGRGDGYAPCTAQACMELLHHYGVDCRGKHAVVIGRSLVVGRPLAMLLLAEDATVTLCHSKTEHLAEITRSADIVVAAVGKLRAIGGECFRPGQIVLDVGTNWDAAAEKFAGDVDFAAAEPLAAAISPVPGGVGSVTTGILAEHVVKAAELILA